MRTLSGRELLSLWEQCEPLHPVDQALAIVAAARPEIPPDELGRLSLGQRDALLLELREALFGHAMEAFVECPLCQEHLVFSMSTAEIRSMAPGGDASGATTLTVEGVSLDYRLPNSEDLAAIVGAPGLEAARMELLRRCVVGAHQDGQPVNPRDLPQPVIDALSAEIESRDPLAELRTDVACPACGHGWSPVLDVTAFLWTEISMQVKQLLRDVHQLARWYGWREADILAMSGRRRQLYLEMANG